MSRYSRKYRFVQDLWVALIFVQLAILVVPSIAWIILAVRKGHDHPDRRPDKWFLASELAAFASLWLLRKWIGRWLDRNHPG